MLRTAFWLTIALTAAGCPSKSDDTADTDVAVDDTDAVDTDVLDTDVAATGCAAADACAGCEEDGEVITCDCTAELPADAATCRPVRVAILDDAPDLEPSSGTLLLPILEEATWDGSTPMFTVVDLGRRWMWQGTLTEPAAPDTGAADTDLAQGEPLSVDNTDVVFLVEGYDYSSSLTEAGAAALASFTAAGGGLIRNEWGASYEELEPEYCPMQAYIDYNDDNVAITWDLVASSDPIAAVIQHGLPATFEMNGSFVQADIKTIEQTGDVLPVAYLTGTLPATESAAIPGLPGVVYWPPSTAGDVDHGPILWISHDFIYENSVEYPTMAEPEFKQLMWNMALAAAIH